MLLQNAVLRIAIAAAGLAIGAASAQAQDAMPVFGVINITPGETLRVNVVNTTDPNVPPDPCNVQVNFVNADGVTVKTASLNVNNGQFGWVNINYFEASRNRATINVDSSVRQALRPVLNLLAPPCRVVTAEVYETASGRGSQYIPPMFLPAVQINANSPAGQ